MAKSKKALNVPKFCVPPITLNGLSLIAGLDSSLILRRIE